MSYDPARHHRRSIRHPQHDYTSPGAYFVTICAKGRECVFDDVGLLSICVDLWRALPRWFPNIVLDEFVVMPNHIHFVVWLGAEGGDVGTGLAPTTLLGERKARPYDFTPEEMIHVWMASAQTNSIGHDWEIPTPQTPQLAPALGDVVGAWKSLVSNTYLAWINKHSLDRQAKFWQRGYYEHIVRNDRALNAIRLYIRNNPDNWELDPDNPNNTRRLPHPSTVDNYLDDVKRFV